MWYGDIGEENGKRLEKYIDNPSYKLFADFGVRDGMISQIFLNQAHKNDGQVVGVDFNADRTTFKGDGRYHLIIGDSTTVASEWNEFDLGRPDVIAIDTTHIGVVTLCELYYLWPLLSPNGLMILHDTCWPAGKKEYSCGEWWDGVDRGVRTFFGLGQDLNDGNEYFKMETHPDSWGMTFIWKKNEKERLDRVIKYQEGFWGYIFSLRRKILESQMNPDSGEDWKISPNAIVNLELKP